MWTYSFRKSLTILILIFTFGGLKASHIVGGEITYKFLGYNADQSKANLEVSLTLYRDPTGIPYDVQANFGIFVQEPWGAWRSYEVVRSVPISPIEEVDADSDPCKTRFLNEARMQRANYTFEVWLDVGESDYLISYQKCCRNFTINNIVGTGGNLGSVYELLITSEALKVANNSPVFSGTPPIFICANFPQEIDQSVLDVDNDDVSYTFCAPLFTGPSGTSCGGGTQNPDPQLCTPPYPEISYLQPFTVANPMGGSPPVSLNGNGIMTGVPELIGSYVVGVCIEETRNGVLMSRMRRDYEFNVVACEENLVAQIEADEFIIDASISDEPIAYFESCDPTTINFINLSEDEKFIEDYLWEIQDPTDNLHFTQSGINNKDATVDFEDRGLYEGMMVLNDGATCFDTAFFIVHIVPEPTLETVCTYDTCVAGPVNFLNLSEEQHSSLSYVWTFGDGNSSTETSPNYQYENRGLYTVRTIATDTFGCSNFISKTLDWYPYELLPPDTIQLDTLLCAEDSIFIFDRWISNSGTFFDYIPSDLLDVILLSKKY